MSKMSDSKESVHGYPFVEFSVEKLYVDRFKKIPSVVYLRPQRRNKEEKCDYYVDFSKINEDSLKDAYDCKDNEVSVITRILKNFELINNKGTLVENVSWSDAFVLDDHVFSEYFIIDSTRRVIINGDAYTMIIFFDPETKDFSEYEIGEKLWDNLPKTKEKGNCDENEASLSMITSTPHGLDVIDAQINYTTIDVDKTYNDDFKPVYEKIKDFVNSDKRGCGIVILNGEPGTGKTTLIRDLISHSDKKFFFISPDLSRNMASPDFVPIMMENPNSVFILEDCEKAIEKREGSGYLSSVASILNMSDGLLGDAYNIKFICTFNCDMENVDPALLRKGRCIAKYTFGKLDKDKVKVLLDENDIEIDKCEDMTLAEIFHYGEETGAEKETKKEKKFGF